MLAHRVNALPVLDEQGAVVGVTAPPMTAASLSPAAPLAWASALSMPSVTQM